MSKQTIAKNYIYNVTYQILIIIIPLITVPYLSRVLGAENIGVWSYTTSITTYFVLFGSLGISMYAQREIAYVQEDKYKLSKIFWEINILRFVTMVISIIIYYFTYIQGTQYTSYYKILILELISACFDIIWFFQGIEDFKKTVTRNVIARFLSMISIFIFVKTQNDLIIYFVIYVLVNFIANISLWTYLPKYIEKIPLRNLEVKKHLKPTISLFIPQIAVQIYTVLDKVMLGYMLENKTELGFYEQAQKVIKSLLFIVTSLAKVMIPRMANTYIKGEKEKLKEYMDKSINLTMLISIPITLGIIAVSNNFVPIFFGEGYEKVSLILSGLSPILMIIGVSNTIGIQYLIPTKRQREYTISVTIGAIINFLINIVLIQKFAAIGAVISTLISEIIVAGIQIYLIRKQINVINILKKSWKYVIIGLVMFASCLGINNLIESNLVSLIVQIIIGILIYGLGLLIVKDKYIFQVLKRINFKNKKYNKNNI